MLKVVVNNITLKDKRIAEISKELNELLKKQVKNKSKKIKP